jgi:CheY-like chemotaxis protein
VPVTLPRVAESAINLAWNEIRHRAQLVKELHPVPRVMGSESRFVQVLVNLLVNAAQAIPEGDAANNRIVLRTGTTADGHAYVEVEDTGTGIPEDRVPHVFEPFWTSKPKGVGTGLGLSICHGIVTAAGGEIRIASTVPGKGTVVRVELPAAPEDAYARASRPPAPRAVLPPVGPRPRILVIDDEIQLGATLRVGLASSCEVLVATSGKDALERLESDDIDLVLCDLMMPEISGMELYERVRESHPELADRFVFMTGGAFTDRARDFLERHGHPRIEKPFSLHDVERLLSTVPDR